MTSTNTKYCFGCQKFRAADDGKLVKRGNRNRWVCMVCYEKRNTSPYAKKAKPVNQEAA